MTVFPSIPIVYPMRRILKVNVRQVRRRQVVPRAGRLYERPLHERPLRAALVQRWVEERHRG